MLSVNTWADCLVAIQQNQVDAITTEWVATAEQKADLEARLKRACDEWQAAHGLVFKTYMFTASRKDEYVAALADIDAGIVDHE